MDSRELNETCPVARWTMWTESLDHETNIIKSFSRNWKTAAAFTQTVGWSMADTKGPEDLGMLIDALWATCHGDHEQRDCVGIGLKWIENFSSSIKQIYFVFGQVVHQSDESGSFSSFLGHLIKMVNVSTQAQSRNEQATNSKGWPSCVLHYSLTHCTILLLYLQFSRSPIHDLTRPWSNESTIHSENSRHPASDCQWQIASHSLLTLASLSLLLGLLGTKSLCGWWHNIECVISSGSSHSRPGQPNVGHQWRDRLLWPRHKAV